MDGEVRSWRPLVQASQPSRQAAATDWTALCDRADVQDLVYSYLRIEDARLRAGALAAVRALAIHPAD
jgi:hypothetical protein